MDAAAAQDLPQSMRCGETDPQQPRQAPAHVHGKAPRAIICCTSVSCQLLPLRGSTAGTELSLKLCRMFLYAMWALFIYAPIHHHYL